MHARLQLWSYRLTARDSRPCGRNSDWTGLGEEAIRRAQMGVEVGAKMTMIQNICYRNGRRNGRDQRGFRLAYYLTSMPMTASVMLT